MINLKSFSTFFLGVHILIPVEKSILKNYDGSGVDVIL